MKEVFLCSNIRLYGDKMYNSSLELIGNGPLILLNSIMKKAAPTNEAESLI